MTTSLNRIAAVAGAAAIVMSAAQQIHRSLQGTGLGIDQFSVASGVVYTTTLVLHLALLTDRRWVWWTVVVADAAIYLQAPVVFWPTVYAARPLDLWDWLEGVWFTALLFLVVCCGIARLTGRSLAPTRSPVDAPSDQDDVVAAR